MSSLGLRKVLNVPNAPALETGGHESCRRNSAHSSLNNWVVDAQKVAQACPNHSLDSHMLLRRTRLRLQQPTMPQRPLQRRLHLHVAQLGDGEVEVLDGRNMLVGVFLQEQFGQIETYQCYFGAEG